MNFCTIKNYYCKIIFFISLFFFYNDYNNVQANNFNQKKELLNPIKKKEELEDVPIFDTMKIDSSKKKTKNKKIIYKKIIFKKTLWMRIKEFLPYTIGKIMYFFNQYPESKKYMMWGAIIMVILIISQGIFLGPDIDSLLLVFSNNKLNIEV